jgi:hypothetical protein
MPDQQITPAPLRHVYTRVEEYEVVRFPENPIITPAMMGNADENINGPALIEMPDWVEPRLGKYYLYFAHHMGRYIRLAYADDLHGPWHIYAPGVLGVEALAWQPDHVASPDVITDNVKQEFRLYFHAPPPPESIDPQDPGPADYIQDSFVATSKDGLTFQLAPGVIGRFPGCHNHSWYLRVWQWKGVYYGMARGGRPLYRSSDGITFETASRSPFERDAGFDGMRHIAVLLEGNILKVFYSRIGDTPEHIRLSTIQLGEDWEHWKATEPVSVIFPETDYEGGNLPLRASVVSAAEERVRELRDPAIFQKDNRTYLLYTVQGEYGIAAAELRPKAGSRRS